MKLLYISANPKTIDTSYSKQVAESFLHNWQQHHPTGTIERLELFSTDVQEIDADILSAWGKRATNTSLTEVEQQKISKMDKVLEQFLAADVYVFASPMWNFLFPARLKNYLDNVVIAGKTFRYTATGPEGLVTERKAVHIQSTGGVYSGTHLNTADAHLKQVLSFIGIEDVTTLAIEGVNQYPEQVDSILEKAHEEAEGLAKSLFVEGFAKL